MKSFCLLALLVSSGLFLSAQDQGNALNINRRLANYFEQFKAEKIFVMTDKVRYKPGETAWFRAFVTDANLKFSSKGERELMVKLYDARGKSEIQQLFKLKNGSASCDILLPKQLTGGIYFLCVYTSATQHPDDISITKLLIDPDYNDQWIIDTRLKDSISVPGQKNEFYAIIRELSGEIQKNSTVRYQLMNGSEMIDKGKAKTNDKGELTIPFTLPPKTTGSPFIMELRANGDVPKMRCFLPSSLDSVRVTFYPEGGTLIPGVASKIGFTAFNQWGMAVEVEGEIKNQDGEPITRVRTMGRGLGMFTLLNAGDQKLRLVISGTTGQNQTFKLPDPDPKGLLMSVLKNDLQFISANLVLADKQKQTIALTMTQASTLWWAADMEINQVARIKIPVDSIPYGINLLSAFSSTGDLLAERILFVDRKQVLNLEMIPERSSLSPGESMKVKLRMTDEKSQPVSGNISISVADQYRQEAGNPKIDESLLVTSGLENPFSLVSSALKGKISQSILLDVFLIANRMKKANGTNPGNINPSMVMEKSQQDAAGSNNMDAQLPVYIAGYAQKYIFAGARSKADASYFANNEGLFPKPPKPERDNSLVYENQRRMLESASSILDVIKTIKPYKLENNLIVFLGGQNSLMHQDGALIVLDGQMLGTNVSNLAGINPADVDHINVSTNPMDIQRYTGLNSVGVIEIWLKRATVKDAPQASGTRELYEEGYRVPGKFPDAPSNPKRDTRTTLTWIPEQSVDASGQFEFSVTAGSVISDFVIEVQGISANGRAGKGSALFKVVK